MKIVLYQPQIPANTGNIVRTCSVTGAELILIRPLGFSTENKMLRRAGLDYWDEVPISYHDDIDAFLENTPHPFYFFSSKASKLYTDIEYTEEDALIFGSETAGLPDYLFEKWPEKFVTLPMKQHKRCLNLSNAANIALYEVIRQTS